MKDRLVGEILQACITPFILQVLLVIFNDRMENLPGHANAMGAAWDGQGAPGSRCPVLLSP